MHHDSGRVIFSQKNRLQEYNVIKTDDLHKYRCDGCHETFTEKDKLEWYENYHSFETMF